MITRCTSVNRPAPLRVTSRDNSVLTLWQNHGGDRNVVLTQTEYDAMVEAGTLEDDVYRNVLEE